MSELSKQPIKILIQISLEIIESDIIKYETPYEDYEDNLDALDTSFPWVGMTFTDIDLEFICKFILINNELLRKVMSGVKISELINKFVIPKSTNYKIQYEVWGPATCTQLYETERESYDKYWAKRGLKVMNIMGDFNYWDGKFVSEEIDNLEEQGFSILYVEAIRETKKLTLDKLVLENTSEVIDTLDKETLLELRNLINQRLSSF